MSVKNPRLYGENMFCSDMTDEQCERILAIRNMKVVERYRHMIFNFPPNVMVGALDNNKSVRQYIVDSKIDYSGFIGELRDYQTVAVAFMRELKRCMIGDGVGLGKTAEISGLLNVLKQEGGLLRFIMAVEATAVGQTQAELMRFTGMNIIVLPGDSVKMKRVLRSINIDKVDGIIIKHSTLRSNTFNAWTASYIGSGGKNNLFNVFILDESSVIKNETSQLHSYTMNICNMVDRVYFLNATAFDKYIMDIYYQFNMMDSKLLPEKSFMTKNFCVWKKGSFWKSERGSDGKYRPTLKTKFDLDGYKNQELFKESLTLTYLGRSKSMVGMNVPHIYKVYTIQPSTEQQTLIAKGYRYPEVLNCPSLLDGKPIQFNRDKVPKLDRLCSLMTSELDGMRVVVYCYHIEAQYVIKEELEQIGLRCCVLNGNDPDGKDKDIKRYELQQAFNRGDYDVMITNMQKSLNLYGADAMVLYSTTATVGRLEQIRGRIDRNVDNSSRLYIMLLYENTGEYTLMADIAKERGKASRELLLDAKTAIDYFMEGVD